MQLRENNQMFSLTRYPKEGMKGNNNIEKKRILFQGKQDLNSTEHILV